MRRFIPSCTAGLLLTLPVLSLAAPAPTAPQLWHQIETLRKTHAIMAGTKPYQPGSRTVDAYTIDLANQSANGAIRTAGGIVKTTRYPNGALVVKENFNLHKKLTGVTAMLKLNGYDKGDRNWIMAAYSPAGKVVAYGKVPACIACHTMVRKQDFVFAPPPTQLISAAVWKGFFPAQTISPAYAKLLRQHPEAIVK